jgi:hypothetical protein
MTNTTYVKISMIMYTFKVRNFPDVKETQTSTATTKLMPKLIFARKHSGPSVNSTAKLQPKLISARRHTGPSINGTLATPSGPSGGKHDGVIVDMTINGHIPNPATFLCTWPRW